MEDMDIGMDVDMGMDIEVDMAMPALVVVIGMFMFVVVVGGWFVWLYSAKRWVGRYVFARMEVGVILSCRLIRPEEGVRVRAYVYLECLSNPLTKTHTEKMKSK